MILVLFIRGKTMRVLIHACPARMWYVRGILAPRLRSDGAEVEIWNDENRDGNLIACMNSFASLKGDGGTWHIQDDVIPCRDFVKRCEEYDKTEMVVYGFCNTQFTDDPYQTGRVHAPDAWHSFQCIRIPDDYARECAEWFFTGDWHDPRNPALEVLRKIGKGDDSFFREFFQLRHGYEMVLNAAPNLVEHVDWIVGGSILSPWRGFLARAEYWNDEEIIAELEQEVKRIRAGE